MKIKILKKNAKQFTGDDGEERDYAYYVAELPDGSARRFGSSDTEKEVGKEYNVFLESVTYKNGGAGWKEIVIAEGEE